MLTGEWWKPGIFDFHTDETAGERFRFRLLELAVAGWACWFAWSWGLYIPRIEAAVLPLGIAQHADLSFMSENGLSLWNAAAITSLCAVAFAVHKAAYLPCALLLHLQYASRYCLGEISHGSNLTGMSLVCLGAGALLFREERLQRRAGIGLLWFFIGLGYGSAAVCKLVASGPGWADGVHLRMWIAERGVDLLSTNGAFAPNLLQQLADSHTLAGTAILAFGLLAELSGPLLWLPCARVAVIPALVAMHLGVTAAMNIRFDAFVCILLLLWTPVPALLERVASTAFDGRKTPPPAAA